jgi:hypothetical protein
VRKESISGLSRGLKDAEMYQWADTQDHMRSLCSVPQPDGLILSLKLDTINCLAPIVSISCVTLASFNYSVQP